MSPPSSTATKFGVKFLSRRERTVKRVTKAETKEIKKRLEPEVPKSVRVRAPPKPKVKKKTNPPPVVTRPATLVKPVKSVSSKRSNVDGPRVLQTTDLEKLARLNCSREFSLFHQVIKRELSQSYENQLAFLQTKLQHLKNEFLNKQVEHLNFEQIREYYNQAVGEHRRRQIKPDEYLTLADKFRQDIKQAIEKWLKKKDFKPPKQVNKYLERRHERVREQIKETMEQQKRLKQQQQEKTAAAETRNSGVAPAVVDDDDEIMILD